ncbi:LytR/AlgR family response regulator transcription factor [Flexithrix dorotheae]|uniref:LytR/AlgR family response regulator transcription factor n=1 Tax=Flexithrix dorotheae TaxID=70993 RepID=UPI000381F6F2|nr:LytTR family DNA-binding domain-containing protein [Flexithrix dorotheae]
MIKFIIVDDEPIAHRIIEKYCNDLPHLKLKRNCYNAFEAIQFLNEESVDIIFLDIKMPKLTGFEFLKSLSNPPKIIVTTAHKEFAWEGYELDISDYLLKPFSFARFVKAVNKATNSTASPTIGNISQEGTNKHFRFFIKGDKRQYQVNTEDIIYIEAYGNYSKIHLKENLLVCHEKISSFEALLPDTSFLRIHKSFIIAIEKVEIIENNQVLIGKQKIPIGQTYKHNLRNLLG